MSERAEDEMGEEPHPAQDENDTGAPADIVEAIDGDVAPVGNEGDAEFDDTEVGHEVAPPRAGPDEDDVGYYAHLHPADEDLVDNVASNVRARPAASLNGEGEEVQPEFEVIPAPAGADDGAEDQQGEQLPASADAGTATAPSSPPAPATSNAAVCQPTQGTQVDAEVDMRAEAPQVEEERAPASAASKYTGSSASAAAQPPNPTSTRGTTAAYAPAAAPLPAKAAAPPSWSQLPQSPHGTAEVTVTVLPMRAIARLRVPVSSPNAYRPIGTEAATTGAAYAAPSAGGGGSGDASPHWVLVAKDLYEGIAEHLLIHPASFRIYHQHKRLRFMGTLFLDCDVTTAPEAASAVNNRAEPLWVSIVFPATEAGDEGGGVSGPASGLSLLSGATAASGHVSGSLNTEEEEAHASLASVPSHLSRLGPEDFVARCIRVRPRKLEVPPRTLVEGRRQGYTYDQVIKRMQALQDAEQTPASHGGRGGDTAVSPGASFTPNFAIMTLVQDGPVPPSTPFLGGYRDKRHPDRVRLHAATQLYHRDLEYSPFAGTPGYTGGAATGGRCTRHTQTIGVSRACQTHREACVQTPRVDLHLEEAHDFIIVARPYFTAAELQVLRTEMAVIIQKLYRQWKARRVRESLEQAEAARQHRAGARQRREEALLMAVEDAAQLRRDDPRSAADFERVKQDIIDWRADEAARIQRDPSLSPAEIRAALLALTETELQLLQQLDQRRRDVGKTQTERRFVQTLQCMAAPKQWGPMHVRTPETERAAELRDLYERLCVTSGGQTAAMAKVLAASAHPGHGGGEGSVAHPTSSPGSMTPQHMGSMRSGTATSPWLVPNSGAAAATSANGSVASACAFHHASGTYNNNINSSNAAVGLSSATAARLDILLRVKWTVREFSTGSALLPELCELIDREADLLHRGRKEASLTSLRRRIQSLFAQFIEDPQYNPVVKEFARTARDRARVKEVERMQEKATTRKSQTTTAA